MIVLDTHALVWWVNGTKELSKKAKQVIEHEYAREKGSILICTITAWEIAMLVKKNRLQLNRDVKTWLDTVAKIPTVQFVPVDLAIAVTSADLPEPFHKDPADRMIVATARHLGSPLVSGDERIRQYPHVKTIW